jgi:DNA-binding SARP family transcriptional activator
VVVAVAVRLHLLGEVSADVDGHPVDLGTPRQRCVLAALAVDADRVVPVDRLIERVWGAAAERRARATLHSYISRLRRALAHADGVSIVHRSGGYALMADEAETEVDLRRFRGRRSGRHARWWRIRPVRRAPSVACRARPPRRTDPSGRRALLVCGGKSPR